MTAQFVWHKFGDLIREQARRHGLDPILVAAVICQESGGRETAIRVERGFWKRYYEGIMRLIRSTPSTRDNHWAQYPDLFACSYGLMQVLYPVALELGLVLDFPTDLCKPERGIQAGCMKLQQCFKQANQSQRQALLRYNGGGDPAYPDKIARWAADLKKFIDSGSVAA
jgi:soluble lytic murein transglycosylase-like protein